jgi:hypothetical protein
VAHEFSTTEDKNRELAFKEQDEQEVQEKK